MSATGTRTGCQHCGSPKGYDRTYGRCSDCGQPYQPGSTGLHFRTKTPPPPEFFARFRPRGVGILPVEPALTGQWPYDGFPASVELEGATFNLAEWAWPLYSGVIAQYRQDTSTNAMHLLVYRNGQYVVRHMDEINPDLNSPIQHALVDAPLASAIVAGVVGLGAGLLLGLCVFSDSSSPNPTIHPRRMQRSR